MLTYGLVSRCLICVTYVLSFAALRCVIKSKPPAVTTAIMDFEAATWVAMAEVLPHVNLRRCGFHWSQALWRKVQDLGLAPDYMNGALTHKFIRRLFSLPFLPAVSIPHVFTFITLIPNMPPTLQRLLDYIDHTWIQSNLWAPAVWSVFNMAIRTNNDLEGWHRRLNSKPNRNNLPFYQLVELLRPRKKCVSHQLKLQNPCGRQVLFSSFFFSQDNFYNNLDGKSGVGVGLRLSLRWCVF